MPVQTIRLVIPSLLHNTPLVGHSVNRICASMGFSEEEAHAIDLCVVEAVTNSIQHSHATNPGEDVEVAVSVHPDRICLQVVDRGAAIDSFEAPRFEFDPNDIENLPEGGMGLYIIHQTMDAVSYRSENGVNTLTMVRYLPSVRRNQPDD